MTDKITLQAWLVICEGHMALGASPRLRKLLAEIKAKLTAFETLPRAA